MSEKVIKFLLLMEKYPCLYNNVISDYSRKDITDRAWVEIGKEMDWSVADCKDKWKNMRNGFVRSIKPPACGASSKGKKPYYLNALMQFVLPYVKPYLNKENAGNVSLLEGDQQTSSSDCEVKEEIEEVVVDEEYPVVTEVTRSTANTYAHASIELTQSTNEHSHSNGPDISFKESCRKRFKDALSDQSTFSEDYNKMFLLSLLPDLNKLCENNLRHFKIKSLLLLEELLSNQNLDVL